MDLVLSLFAPLWSNWLVAALVAPALFAVVNILDVYFTTGEVYEDEYDGTVISALFQGLVWLVAPFVSLNLDNHYAMGLAFASGVFFIISTFFYFKAMFFSNDAVVIELIWGLTLVVVPVIGFLAVDERLSLNQYIGIAMAFVGSSLPVLNSDIRESFGSVLGLMLLAVMFLSASMVMEEEFYKELEFMTGFLFFSLGALFGGLCFVFVRKWRTGRGIASIVALSKKHFGMFLVAEAIAVGAITFSNRAVDLASSPSLVTVVDCTQEMFILIFSCLILIFSRNNGKVGLESVFEKQTRGWWLKTASFVMIAEGVWLVTI